MVKFNRYKNGVKRAITLSYDDGQKADIRLVEIFNKYGMKATFHLNGNRYQNMTDEELKEVAKIYEGHEVSCHTFHHPHLETLPMQICTKDIADDKMILEKMCGYIVRGMSYPFGTYNDDIINAMRSGGMEYSRTVNSTNSFNIPKDFMVWNPTCHHNADLLGLLEKFHSISWIDIPLFYIWGHSYEFDRDNNWDKIEEFCEKASGHEDVWYATNIELVDYINALKQIRFSWNRRLAYNPTVTDVWVQVGSEAIKIGAGETVDLGEEATK